MSAARGASAVPGVADLTVAAEGIGRTLTEAFDGTVGRLLYGVGAAPAAVPAAARPPEGAEGVESLTDEEQRLLREVDTFLARGLDLKRWWEAASGAGKFAESFDLGRTFNEPATSFGFFDRADVAGQTMPVMGNFQEMFYDQPKSPRDGQTDAALWMRDQMREFVLRYFMRVSDFRQPEGYAEQQRLASGPLALLSWCPKENVALKGFGFQQLYYKRRDTGAVGRFPQEERFAIVDLREIGPVYDWIVVKVCIFDFNFEFRPFGPGTPQLVLPLQEDSYLVLTRDFVVAQEDPEPSVLARYGLGYAFIKNPQSGFLAYGPGEFDAAIELIDFEVRQSGQTRVEMVFVANRPTRLVNFAIDPIGWSFRLADLASFGVASRLLGPARDLFAALPFTRLEFDPVFAYADTANLLTGGLAAQSLCISRQQLDKDFLVKHFMQHYQTIAGSLATWRVVADWLDTASLPVWAVHGRSF